MKKTINLIWQPLVLFFFLVFILTLFYWHASSNIIWAVGAGSLASSGYIIFTKPSSITSGPSNIVVSYLIAIFVGVFIRYGVEQWLSSCIYFWNGRPLCWTVVMAALAVVMSLWIGLVLKAEHPPAAGIALVLVLEVKDYQTLIIILFSVMMLAFLRLGLRRWLQDLF